MIARRGVVRSQGEEDRNLRGQQDQFTSTMMACTGRKINQNAAREIDLRKCNKITDSCSFGPLGPNGVVPFSVKPVRLKSDVGHLIVRHDDTLRIGVAINLRADPKACRSPG